jgi:hypothetical protein
MELTALINKPKMSFQSLFCFIFSFVTFGIFICSSRNIVHVVKGDYDLLKHAWGKRLEYQLLMVKMW